jgi:hypothetical protein
MFAFLYILLGLVVHCVAYDDDILTNKNVVLRFSSRDCKLCDAQLDQWLSAVQSVDREDIHAENIYCEDREQLCKEFNIVQYPSIKYNTGFEWLINPSQTAIELKLFLTHLSKPCRRHNRNGCSKETLKWLKETDTGQVSTVQLKKQLSRYMNKTMAVVLHAQEFADARRVVQEKMLFTKQDVNEEM